MDPGSPMSVAVLRTTPQLPLYCSGMEEIVAFVRLNVTLLRLPAHGQLWD